MFPTNQEKKSQNQLFLNLEINRFIRINLADFIRTIGVSHRFIIEYIKKNIKKYLKNKQSISDEYCKQIAVN